MKIIGLSGRMRVGKTTLADLIANQVPGAIRVSYADALRLEVAELLGVSPKLVRENIFKGMTFRIGAKEMAGREVLQWWGTEIRRAADPAYWVNKMSETLDEIESVGTPLVCIDDVRFLDEAHLIESRGGLLVRLEPHPNWTPGEHASHASETALDGYAFPRRYAPEFGQLGELADNLAREAAA